MKNILCDFLNLIRKKEHRRLKKTELNFSKLSNCLTLSLCFSILLNIDSVPATSFVNLLDQVRPS